MWQSLLKYVVYPLTIKLGSWIWDKYLINEADKYNQDLNKQKESLNRAIEKADNDEDINNLSIIMHKLDRL